MATQKNTGLTAIVLPDGTRVEPGDTFSDKNIPAEQLAAWHKARNCAPVKRSADKKEKK